MRVLVVSAPLIGHEVCVATGGDATAVTRAGLPAEDVAPGFAMGRLVVPVALRHPLTARSELQGRAGTRGVALLFGRVNDRLAGPTPRPSRSRRRA